MTSCNVEITYAVAMQVTSSWDQLKKIPNYKIVFGELIFQRLFELEPETRSIFHMEMVKDFKLHPSFSPHAAIIVDMIECAVDFLGPEFDSLAEHLVVLGQRHIRYGVRPSQIPAMGTASIFAMENLLGSKFTPKDGEDWATIFQFINEKMIEAMNM